MKKIITIALLLLAMAAYAEIPGKIYVEGDSIHMDGMVCLVFKVNEDGTHGTAVCPKGKISGMEKTAIKLNLKNKKGLGMSGAEADSLIAECAYSIIPPVPTRKGSKSNTQVYDYAQWKTMVPQGWRLINLEEAKELLALVKQYNNLTYKKMKDYNITEQAYKFFIAFVTDIESTHGVIGTDAGNSSVSFIRLQGKKLDEYSGYGGKEKTMAVKDF